MMFSSFKSYKPHLPGLRSLLLMHHALGVAVGHAWHADN